MPKLDPLGTSHERPCSVLPETCSKTVIGPEFDSVQPPKVCTRTLYRHLQNQSKIEYVHFSATESSSSHVRVLVSTLFHSPNLWFLAKPDTFAILCTCTRSHVQCNILSKIILVLQNRIHILTEQFTAFFLEWTAPRTVPQDRFGFKCMDSPCSAELVQNWSRSGLEVV